MVQKTNDDDEQLSLPGLSYFCSDKSCREEVDYFALEMDGVYLCHTHWLEWCKTISSEEVALRG